MAQLGGRDEIESFPSSLHRHVSSSRTSSRRSDGGGDDEECPQQWAPIQRLPTFERINSAIVYGEGVDVTKVDNLRLLQEVRTRTDGIDEKLPTVEVRYKNLRVEADCKVVHGKPLPTLWNSLKSLLSEVNILPGLSSKKTRITIIDDVSGIIKPKRMTLLLGPPGCGKTTLLKALSGNLSKSLIVKGEVSYNGYTLNEFIPQKTSSYIGQSDLHIPEMTVRETIDFSACCLGAENRADAMLAVNRKEKQAGILPNSNLDTCMKTISVEGQKTNLQTDYILKILGLDICADTITGDAMRRGISGGQKKRLTIGEMIVGPTKALFMDEISNGLDSSTTYQIIAYLQQLAHIFDATVFVALLQPAPETFDLFDDVVLMAEGKVVYHGPRSHVLEFFEDCGFRCPKRKRVTDFLQEVLSEKDQLQYWHRAEQPYYYISIDTFCGKFKESALGKKQFEDLLNPIVKSAGNRIAISFRKYSLSKWKLFRICMSREYLLMRRNAFVYMLKTSQLVIVASVFMTILLHTRMEVDTVHANYFLGALFFAQMILFFDGFPEFAMTLSRLPSFYKQRELYFYPAWAYAIPATILKVPISFLEALIWTSMTYYTIGYSPEVGRFFRQLILLFAWHLVATSFFRFVASVFRTEVASVAGGGFVGLLLIAFGGFIIPKTSMPIWLKYGFWISPMSYAEMGLALNEFLSPRWVKMHSSNTTYGVNTLETRGLNYSDKLYWISLGALFGFIVILNIGFIWALTFLDPPVSHVIVSSEKHSMVKKSKDSTRGGHLETETQVVFPFEPLTIVFEDVQYYIGTPSGMRDHEFAKEKLQLLCNITGAFKPGVLTALMGVSGAGKTTLLDVLSGRKTRGTIEGEIRIGGFPKVQETFARISGYCEQNDIHSPQITVQESLIVSAWLRLDPLISSKNKYKFVKQVIETTELNHVKDSLVGLPGISGLTFEQRKRLTVAVELVANPSIIFMDEPTTGLDAKAAATVMHAVKNVVDTGRTIVSTIHQPSIDIFEAFDEDIPGVPDIKGNYNPATWILEVTSSSAEANLGVDFAQVYRNSALYRKNQELVMSLKAPPPGSKELSFPSKYSQNGWGQFKCCLWKQYLSYWRSPAYNFLRFSSTVTASMLIGLLFWDQGTKIHNQQSLFTILGSMFIAVIPLGTNNCSIVSSYISTERTVLYREMFAGMYSPWAYALAQVIIEVPYLLAQVLVFMLITYPMIGYHWTAYKVLWTFYIVFCTTLCYTYLGMMLVAITPSFQVAALLQSPVYSALDLFSGFFVPRPQMPKWWLWMYYVSPSSWILNALLTTQYGDVHREISVFGETKTVSDFLKDYFGFHHDQLPWVGVVLMLYPIVFASLFAYFIGKLNFQRR